MFFAPLLATRMANAKTSVALGDRDDPRVTEQKDAAIARYRAEHRAGNSTNHLHDVQVWQLVTADARRYFLPDQGLSGVESKAA